jgi:hypothetical protein
VTGTDARVALVEQGGEVRAYVCGGASSYGALSRWFTLHDAAGAPSGAMRTVEGESEGWRLEGSLTADRWQGRLVAPEGSEVLWAAPRVLEGTTAGLYETTDELGIIGAIVDQEDGATVVQGTLIGKGNIRAQVTPVRPFEQPGVLRIQIAANPGLPGGLAAGPQVRLLAAVLPSH